MNRIKGSVQTIADQLDQALQRKQTIDPVIVIDPSLNIDDAYSIQMMNVARAVQCGDRITGKKIGLTSLAMQQMLGVNEPDYGHLFASLDVSGGSASMDRLIQPKVEGEIAFVLKEDLHGPDVSLEDVLAATEYVVGAIEIVDSRVRDWKIGLIDTVADNASTGAYLLGNVKLSPDAFSMPDETMQLFKNGQLVNAGRGTDVMGHPATCVAWLANKLHRYGVTLQRGEVVLSGALTAAVPTARGDRFEVVFGNLGTVAVAFV